MKFENPFIKPRIMKSEIASDDFEMVKEKISENLKKEKKERESENIGLGAQEAGAAIIGDHEKELNLQEKINGNQKHIDNLKALTENDGLLEEEYYKNN
mgnify:CR=1 FL=1|tara:strand:+ start:618 stop:914 length:297 start_codon:yes stop_codon:yes gene_type:complete